MALSDKPVGKTGGQYTGIEKETLGFYDEMV
jgi:hypothetical protein